MRSHWTLDWYCMRYVRIADQYLSLFAEKSYHLFRVFKLVVHLGMFEVHLLSAKETGRNGVVGMLEVLFLLVGGEKGPAEQTRAQFVGRLVVVLDAGYELFELFALPMDVAQLVSGLLGH